MKVQELDDRLLFYWAIIGMFSLSTNISFMILFFISLVMLVRTLFTIQFLGRLQQETGRVNGGGTHNTSAEEHSQSGIRKRPYTHVANDAVRSTDVPNAVNSELNEEKRTGKRNRGSSFVSHTDKSASKVTDTGVTRARQMKTRRM
jgi:hypothetical protein